MATSKTLTPTNVTISIPEMTDSPDASVFSNCVDKEADAINSLNSNKLQIDSAFQTIDKTRIKSVVGAAVVEGTGSTNLFAISLNDITGGRVTNNSNVIIANFFALDTNYVPIGVRKSSSNDKIVVLFDNIIASTDTVQLRYEIIYYV